ncbi:MAG: Wadjet anti-phage system protein JetD domain-containing protein [Coriobacteriaceae bacterium]
MAHKLNEAERQHIVWLRDALTSHFPPAKRSAAPGLASALVRLAGQTISKKELEEILDKYEANVPELKSCVINIALKKTSNSSYALKDMSEDVQKDPKKSKDSKSKTTDKPKIPQKAISQDAKPQKKTEAHPETEKTDKADPSKSIQSAADASEKDKKSDAPQNAQGKMKDNTLAVFAEKVKTPLVHEGPKRVHHVIEHQKSEASVKEHETKTKSSHTQQHKWATQRTITTRNAQKAPKVSEKKSPEIKQDLPPLPEPRDLRKIPRVRRGGETEDEIRKKIIQLDKRFWMNGWLLAHPKAYTLFEKEIMAIDVALKAGEIPSHLSRRQLAYKLDGDEKFFEYNSDGFRLLRALGMEDLIQHRPLPKTDLIYHAPRRRKHMQVLVTENLDPYLDVRDLMYEEGKTTILGEHIHAVVLGGGSPVLEHNRLQLLLDTLGAEKIDLLYWGDIDRAGVNLMARLQDVLGDSYKVKPFASAYTLMVDKAIERFPKPEDNERTKQINIEEVDPTLLCSALNKKESNYVREVLEDCALIPQEIITKDDLK